MQNSWIKMIKNNPFTTFAFYQLIYICLMSLRTSALSRICKGNEHLNGAWVVDPPKSKSFVCCPAFVEKNPTHCNPPTTPFNYQVFSGHNNHTVPVLAHGCACDDHEGHLELSQREKYKWKPTSCELLEWNASQFCALLGNQHMLLVGDSLMEQTAITLMSMVQQGRGGCAHQLHSGTSYRLTFGLKGSPATWIQHYERVRPNITIMNTGAHFEDSGDLWSVWSGIKSQIAEMKAKYPEDTSKYAYRSSIPGHYGCTKHVVPVDSFDVFKEIQPDPFRYTIFPEFDHASLKSYKSVNNMSYIDMSPLYLRPDGHSGLMSNGKMDCLHFCLPGPLDLFSNILLTMMYNNEL